MDIDIHKKSVSANMTFNHLLHELWHGWNWFYTDASKLSEEGCVGLSMFYQNSRTILQYKCPPYSSVFTGECAAVLEACLYIECHNMKKAVIFTDSRSCLEALDQDPFCSKINSCLILDIRNVLYKCRIKGQQVVLCWIPSHVGITGNEFADLWAKKAILEATDRKYFSNNAYDLVASADRLLRKRWNSSWVVSTRSKGSHYFKIQPTIPIRT